MSDELGQITPLLYIFGLMVPGMIAIGVHDSVKNTKTVIASAVLALPLTIAVFQIITTATPAAGIDRIGYLFTGALFVPITYLVLAPTVYLLITGIHYLYVKYYN